MPTAFVWRDPSTLGDAATNAKSKVDALGDSLARAAQLSDAFHRRSIELGVANGNLPPQALGDAPNSVLERERERLNALRRRLATQGQQRRSGGGGGGGRSSVGPTDADLERLREQFATEQELLDKQLAETLEKLRAFREQKRIEEQEFNELEAAARQKHLEDMNQLERQKQQARLQTVSAGLSGLASLMQTENKKLFKIGQAAAIAEAGMNAWRAYNQVLADPTLPYVAKSIAAAGILAQGLTAVRSIKSQSSSGGGVGASAGASTGTTAPQVSRNVTIDMRGEVFGRDQVIGLINQINQAQEDGAAIIRVA